MGKFYRIGLCFLIISLQSISAQTDSLIQEIIDEVNIDTLYKYVSELSGATQTIIGGVPYTISSRYKSQLGNDKATDFIKEKLESFSLPAYNQTSGSTLRNVYAVQTGTVNPNQKYIVSAHYDAMPSGTLAPGADDNASGTAVVLEAARILSQYTTKYTIVYALWDEEEQGLIGSNFYANLASTSGENILGVINLDMIAWESNGDNKINIHTNNNSLSLSDKMVEVNTTYNLNLLSFVKNPGLTASDHSSFWNYGYKAIMLIEDYYGDFNAYYHSTNDLVQNFNLPYFDRCAKLSIGTLASFISVEGKLPVKIIALENEPASISFELLQNYPNPFNPSTRIQYQVSSSSHVTLKVYDVLGNEVATLVDEYKLAGSYEVEFDASSRIWNLACGIYYYQMRANNYIETKKMLYLK
jgi:hypothetical protein